MRKLTTYYSGPVSIFFLGLYMWAIAGNAFLDISHDMVSFIKDNSIHHHHHNSDHNHIHHDHTHPLLDLIKEKNKHSKEEKHSKSNWDNKTLTTHLVSEFREGFSYRLVVQNCYTQNSTITSGFYRIDLPPPKV